jgi:hypothetical protein
LRRREIRVKNAPTATNLDNQQRERDGCPNSPLFMELHGKNLIGGKVVAAGSAKTFSGIAAATGEKLSPLFYEATTAEADEAFCSAGLFFKIFPMPRCRWNCRTKTRGIPGDWWTAS